MSGRFQLSDEKAKRVSVPIPRSRAASTARRTASTPAACPAVRGRPRATAQRPLPSMMMATWSPEALFMIPPLANDFVMQSCGREAAPAHPSRVAWMIASMWSR